MPDHRFDGTDWYPISLLAPDFLESIGLMKIILARRRSMRINVSDFIWGNFCHLQRGLDGLSHILPIALQTGHVIRIERASVPSYFSVDHWRAPPHGVFQRFQDQKGAALAKHKAIACLIERTRCCFRRVISRAGAFDCVKGGHIHRADSRLRGSSNRHVYLAIVNPLESVSHGVNASGAA